MVSFNHLALTFVPLQYLSRVSLIASETIHTLFKITWLKNLQRAEPKFGKLRLLVQKARCEHPDNFVGSAKIKYHLELESTNFSKK